MLAKVIRVVGAAAEEAGLPLYRYANPVVWLVLVAPQLASVTGITVLGLMAVLPAVAGDPLGYDADEAYDAARRVGAAGASQAQA